MLHNFGLIHKHLQSSLTISAKNWKNKQEENGSEWIMNPIFKYSKSLGGTGLKNDNPRRQWTTLITDLGKFTLTCHIIIIVQQFPDRVKHKLTSNLQNVYQREQREKCWVLTTTDFTTAAWSFIIAMSLSFAKSLWFSPNMFVWEHAVLLKCISNKRHFTKHVPFSACYTCFHNTIVRF